MPCRKSVTAMLAAGEQGAFVQAVLDLKNVSPSIIPAAQAAGAQGRYDDYVWLHQAAFSTIHLGPAFGPWHREILRQFELDLQAVSGNPDIYVPYWDWPTARQPGDPGWPFVDDLMGGFGTGAGNAVVSGPFAGSTGDFDINVRDAGESHTVLRRASVMDPASLSLPDTQTTIDSLAAQPYDSVPFNDNNFPTAAQAAASFRKSLEFFLHNGPHNWVGRDTVPPPPDLFLDMMALASPNDPIFFLHHAQVDRMWSVWQDKYPALDHFLPLSGANPGHNLNNVMDVMDASYFNFPVLATNAANVDLHASGVWYDTDLPSVSLATPSVSFGTIPAGLTTYAAVQFTVEGCRSLRFRITGISGPYAIPPGNTVVQVPASDDPSSRTENVFVSCTAPSDGSPVGPGSVSIDAFIIDDEGYLAGTAGAEHVIGSFTATLSAIVQPRQTSAVAFVSDRSGSMSGTAGGGLRKFDLLEEALEIATDVMDAADSASLVFFDQAVSTPLPMSAIGGGGGVSAALADPSIQPSGGSTAIGLGLIAGASELDSYVAPAGVTDPNLAVLCLTDGNENVQPYVTSGPVTGALSAYSSDVYAIGLGTEDNVSAGTLGSISQYMLITGDNAADQRRFMVTKYFVQILADVKKADIIVDPDGTLHVGMIHEVPFDVSEADVEVEIIILCPAARYLEFEVRTPGGDRLGPGSLGPNGTLEVNPLDAIVRFVLPALPGSPGTSHAGRWTLRMGLSEKALGHVRERLAAMSAAGQNPSVDYSVIVQTRSNLSFQVGRSFPHLTLGDSIPLVASLMQYRLPLTSASMTAHVTSPDGSVSQHALTLDASDQFVADIPAPARGVYTCRVVAQGLTRGGLRFTREATRTFGVGDPTRRPVPTDDGGSELLCSLIECLMRDPGVSRWMESNDMDIKRLKKCLAKACEDPGESGGRDPRSKPVGRPFHELSSADFMAFLRRAVREHEAVDMLAAPEPEPLALPEVDPAFLNAPMFMPALARNQRGELVMATTGKPVPQRGDPDIEVARLKGVSRESAKKLKEAGFDTAGDLLARPQPLQGILDLPKPKVRDILAAARTGDIKPSARRQRKPPEETE